MFTLRQLLEQLHLLRRELEDEVTTLEQTEDQFNASLAKMREQAEQKRARVRFLELQVQAIQSRRGRGMPQPKPPKDSDDARP